MRQLALVAMVATGLSVCSSSVAVAGLAGFAADGSLLEWGGIVLDYNSTDWSAAGLTNNATHPGNLGSGTGDGFSFVYHLEDQSDTAGSSGYLGPNHGGQNYDGEFLAVGQTDTHYLIAIVTGQRPDNGLSNYSPGDIYLRTETGSVYGIEVGGYFDGSTDSTVDLGDSGASFEILTNGQTAANGMTEHTGAQVAGSLWSTDAGIDGDNPGDWLWDPINPERRTQLDATKLDGTNDGLATEYHYSLNSLDFNEDGIGQHAVIEVAIAKSLFGGLALEAVEWSPGCGNDELSVFVPTQTTEIPEPTSLALLGMGALSFLGLRRRRKTETVA